MHDVVRADVPCTSCNCLDTYTVVVFPRTHVNKFEGVDSDGTAHAAVPMLL